MAIPLIISYSQANLKSISNESSDTLNGLLGVHQCQFYYFESQKGPKKIRICIDNCDWNVIVEIERDNLYFKNPWFKKQRLLPIVREADAICQECEIIFVDYRQSPVTSLINMGKATQFESIQALVLKCSKLQKPIIRPNRDKEREIWSAYCEGLNALNKEHRDFLNINYVGAPILFNDTRLGNIHTLKLGIDHSSLDTMPNRIVEKLKDKYSIKEVFFDASRTKLNIHFKGIEKILDDDITEISNLLCDYGFVLSEEGVINVLKVSISVNDLMQRTDLYATLDATLESNGLVFRNNEKLEYHFDNDTDAQRFIDIADNIFVELGHAVKKNCLFAEFSCDDNILRQINEEIADNAKLSITDKGLRLMPDNKEDYEFLIEYARGLFNRYDVDLEFPFYSTTCLIVCDKINKYRVLMHKVDEKLSDFKRLSYRFENDIEEAPVIRFEFIFHSSEERERIIDELSKKVSSLGRSYKITIKNRYGSTRLEFVKDASASKRLDEELRINYQGEDIKLVTGQAYKELFSEVSDPDDIVDADLRERYSRFMNECPIIGTCHKRSEDSIIVHLSEDFYNGDEMAQPIHKGDMVFFPAAGTSTVLRRQYEAMLRIIRPGEIVNGRKIEPPVNPQLCSFLFDPLYANDIHQDISQTINAIRNNRLENNLNDKQIESIAKAILARDIAFIQGPPGTGKTTVIAEIIWQVIRNSPKSKILLTSQTNLAVDNALERLREKRSIRPLRVVSEQRLDSEDIIYNVNLLDTWVNSPNEYNKNNVVEKWIDSIVERLDSQSDYSEITSEWRDCLVGKDTTVRKEFVSRYKLGVNLIAATCSICGSRVFKQMFEKMYETDDLAFDVVIMDEASKATPLEMAIPMVLGKKIIVIGDHKQLPPVMDENSIDTALKKIGKDELAAKIQNMKESQFKKLFLLCQKFKPNLVTTLDTQYRMHKDIMMTVNQFYEDELGENGLKCGIESVMDVPDFKVRGSRWHGISLEPFLSTSTHAIWVNVESKEEKEDTSYFNRGEMQAVKTIVRALSKADGFYEYVHAQEKMEDKEIGLITFYSAQKRALKRLEQNGELDKYCDYRIDVVDRFQGMERNIVIVSTVRSNPYNNIGFAKEIERINVAFSRARSLLIVIGNRNLFYAKSNYRKSINAMEYIDIRQIEDLLRNE